MHAMRKKFLHSSNFWCYSVSNHNLYYIRKETTLVNVLLHVNNILLLNYLDQITTIKKINIK